MTTRKARAKRNEKWDVRAEPWEEVERELSTRSKASLGDKAFDPEGSPLRKSGLFKRGELFSAAPILQHKENEIEMA